jgi:hypothetical protein
MIGPLGFYAAALLFGLYGYSVKIERTKDGPAGILRLSSFRYAYYMLALACAIWATSTLLGKDDPSMLSDGVIFGNAALLAGTVSIIDTILPKKHRQTLLLVLGGSLAALLFARAMFLPPQAYVQNGILVFNSPTILTIAFSVLFVGIWLPINLLVSRHVTKKIAVLPLKTISAISFVIATMGVLVFLAARRPTGLALSFAVICCAFASLAATNYLERKLAR